VSDRHAALARETRSSAGVVLAVLLALILVLATWFLVAGAMGRPSITVNDHTDNAVPTVDLKAPAWPVTV
jgi:hypothetical protein